MNSPSIVPPSASNEALLTERSAAKHLFLGDILEENLFPFPRIRERDRELLTPIIDAIDEFLDAKGADLRAWDDDGEQPAEFLQALRDMGLFGLIIPEVEQGMELSNAAYARVIGQTSRHDSSVSLTIGAHSSIGMKGLLLWGNEEQRARYLPRLASGELIAAFCLTESGAGSDAASIRTKAEKQADGSWLLNGEKIWITNGGIAGFYTVFARTDSDSGKISAFLVEADWPGVAHGPHEDKMGIRASNTCTVSFTDVRVPAANLLGEEGHGFKVAMSILNSGRTGLGGGAVGAMKRLIELCSAQAQDRKQFGRPIAEYGLVREKIAQMNVDCFAAESAVFMVAHYIDAGCLDYSTEAAISKIFASEALQRTAHEALQIAAGNGFMKEFPYEKFSRDARILSIFEGTNEILRLYVALSGLKDVGTSLSELKSAVGKIFDDPIKGFGVLSSYAQRRFSQSTGIGGDEIRRALSPRLAKLASIYEKYTRELARVSDEALRRFGRGITEQQFALKRIGDISIDLFIGLCVISRAQGLIEAGNSNADEAETIAEVFTRQARRRMLRNVRGMERNEDPEIDRLAASALGRGRYGFDVLD